MSSDGPPRCTGEALIGGLFAPGNARLMAAAEEDYRQEPPRLTVESAIKPPFEFCDDRSLAEMVADAPPQDGERLPRPGEVWRHIETGAEYGIMQITNRRAEPERRTEFPLTVVYWDFARQCHWSRPWSEFQRRCRPKSSHHNRDR